MIDPEIDRYYNQGKEQGKDWIILYVRRGENPQNHSREITATKLFNCGYHWMRGIRKGLMKRMECLIRKKRIILIDLTSGKNRTDAFRFYKTLGYRETGMRFVKGLEKYSEG